MDRLFADFRFALSSLAENSDAPPALVAMHPDTLMMLIVHSARSWPNGRGLTCDRDGRYHLDGIRIEPQATLPVNTFRLFSIEGWAKQRAERSDK